MRRLMFLEFAAVGVLVYAASLGFDRIFADSTLSLALFGAVAIPLGLVIVGMYRRASITTSMLWSLLGFVVYTTYAVLGDTAPNVVPTLTTVRELSKGLTSGWAELLTISLPAPPLPHLLVLPLALAWTASALAGEFAHRSRSTAAPVLPAIGVYLLTLAFAASLPQGSLALPLVIGASVLLVLLVHANRWAVLEPAGLRARPVEDDEHDVPLGNRTLSVDTSANRWILLGLPVIALAVAVAGVVGPRVPHRSGTFDPRSLRDQQKEADQAPNPLAGLKAELALSPDNPPVRFSIQLDAGGTSTTIDRVRLAELDRFDGANWSSSASFARAGDVLPAGPDLDVATTEVVQRIVITSLGPGPWLPAADRPVKISATDGSDLVLAVDPDSGVVITRLDALGGLAYEVTSAVPQPTDAQLSELAAQSSRRDVSELTDVPNMPAELRQLAQQLTKDAPTPYEKLVALQNALHDGYAYSEGVPSGSSYGRLSQFLTEDGGGYAEQFAAAFATMSRSLGFPTRLAFGYLVAETDADTGQLVTQTDITSRQAHVWPEVLLGDSLWVPFEPTPSRVATALPNQTQEVPPASGDGGVIATGAGGSNGAGTGAAFESEQRNDSVLLSTPVLAVLTLLTAILMLLLTLVVLKRMRRRRRRHQASTSRQVLGAWAEVTDRLLEVGVTVDRSMTAKEVVSVSSPRLPDRAADRLDVMVPLVTFALYSPIPPTDSAAAEMWTHADAFKREVLEGQQWYRGTVALLNPRPLLLGVNRR